MAILSGSKGTWNVGREPGLVYISAGEKVFLRQIPLILPDLYIVWPSKAPKMLLKLHFDFVSGFQAFNHLPIGMRNFQMCVE